MPSIGDNTEVPRKDLHVFYILDTSGSMEGTRISSLNHAVEETIMALSSEAQSNSDANLKIAAMEFNTTPRWVTEFGPENAEDFVWEYLKAGGLTEVGSALDELNSKLSKNGYLQSMTGALMPVIIFMSDGYSTDEYDKALGEIRQNKWFRRATKIGIAVGDDADKKMISEVVGNSEAVIKVNDMDLFVKLIRFVSVTASMLNSVSQTSQTAANGATVVDSAIKSLGLDDSIKVNLGDNDYNKEPEPVDDDEDTWDDDEWE